MKISSIEKIIKLEKSKILKMNQKIFNLQNQRESCKDLIEKLDKDFDYEKQFSNSNFFHESYFIKNRNLKKNFLEKFTEITLQIKILEKEIKKNHIKLKKYKNYLSYQKDKINKYCKNQKVKKIKKIINSIISRENFSTINE
ncbi:MAG: hypothetical protein ISN64_02775 [Rickettsia sp.]|nr:hypothetical protein [Rickettsia sp.]